MPNDDFSIKTGIQVDDTGLQKLKEFSEALSTVSDSLNKIGSGKFNTGISTELKTAQKEIDKTKKGFKDLSNTLNNKSGANASKGKSLNVEQAVKSTFNAIDPSTYASIEESLSNAALAAEKIKNALGGNIQSGLLTQINDMLAKKDELQNLMVILSANQNALNNAAKATGSKADKNAVPYNTYNSNYKQWLQDGIASLEAKYPDSDIVGAKISQNANGLVKLSASIRSATGEWQKYNATVTETGKLILPSPKIMNNKESESAEKAFQGIKAGVISPDDFLNFDEMEKYSTQVSKIFGEVYGETERYTARVDAMGKVSISKMFPDGKEVNTLTAQYNDVKALIDNYNNCAGDMVKLKQFIESTFTNASYTNAGQPEKTSSSSLGGAVSKYITDRSYVGDYKALANNEAEFQVMNQFQANTTKWNALSKEREAVYNRIKNIAPQNATETNAKNDYEYLSRTISQNISSYSTQIQQAFTDIKSIEDTKSQISGASAVFDSSRDKVVKWAAALSSGKMSITDFNQNVGTLKSSLNSIYKVIQPGSDKESGVAALKSMFTDISGNAKNLNFDSITTRINAAGQEVVKMTASFNESAGSVRKLTGQVNLATGEVQKLGDSTTNVKSGFSRFFDGWKGKISQLATFLTSFYALRQAWNVLKEGISVITEFDTALAEMRKVSTESVSSLKQFQKESFDLAKSVGSTALQIQNSTADFMRAGESFEEAKVSAKNANKLLTVSEFENIDDATSALVSMKAAYEDLSEDQIIDKLNAVGDNFAISTDQIATGLQKAGATLSLLGNNIDEAAALITAANTTLQDVNTVAAGVRTISLRIMGKFYAQTCSNTWMCSYTLVSSYIG